MARKSLGFMQLAIVVGYSLFYTLYLIVFFGLFIHFPSNMSFIQGHLGQVAFFAGTIIGSLLILGWFRKRNSSDIVTNNVFIWAFRAFAFALPLCAIADALGVSLSAYIFYPSCLLGALHVAPAFVYWDDLCERGYLRNSMYTHGVIFAIGGCAFLICTIFLSQLALGIICIALVILNTYLLLFINKRAEPFSDRSIDSSVETFKGMKHLDLVAFAVTSSFGFAFILFYYKYGAGILGVMGIAIAADFLLSILTRRGYVIPFVGMLRISTVVSCIALMVFVIPSPIAKTTALAVILALWFLYRTVNGGALVELANSRDLSIQYTVDRGKLPSNIGFCCGLALGIANVSMGNLEASSPYFALGMAAFMILFALMLLPFDNESNVPGLKTLMPFKATEVPSRVNNSRPEQCKRLAQHYKLSPREIEVLAFIAEGRNAKHVADKLYISESTAKTHMANIYRKVNVHSQQELLDLLDQT